MALEAGSSSVADQMILPADVALAWASLKRAKAVLQRLENGLERQEWCHTGTWSGRRPEWDRNDEPSQDQEEAKDAIWMDLQARESSPSRCRLEGDPEKRDVTGASSLTVGSHPAGSNSDSRRTCPPDAQEDPHLAMPALALSRPPARMSCSCPSQEEAVELAPGALPLSFSKSSLASLGTASGLRKKTSPRQVAPATLSPVLGNCHLAWRLEDLKENSSEDLKLQKLKARIQEQRQQHLSWELPKGRRPLLSSFREGHLGWQHPLKRKVCKLAMAAATTAAENLGFRAVGMTVDPWLPREEKGASGSQEPLTYPEQKSVAKPQPQTPGRRGRATRTRKRPGPSHAAPVPGKAWKKRGAHLFGASAWREGQRLARKILGPLLEPLNQRRSTEEEAVATSGTGAKAEPGQESSGLSQIKDTPGGEQKSHQSRQSEADEAQRATEGAGADQVWEVPPGTHGRSLKGQALRKEEEQQPRPVSRKETTGPNPDSGCVQTSCSLEIMNTPAITPLLREPGGPSANNCGRLNRSSQRSSPLHSPTGKEKQPASSDRWKRRRGHPYSPEEVRKFMTKKVAERNKRTQAAKQASEQACEVRSRRLQEVYRKQRAALGRKRSRMEAPQQIEGGSSITLDKPDHKSGQGCENDGPSDVMEWIQQVSAALLRHEPKGSSSTLKMARRGKRSRMPDSPFSLTPGGRASSPLKLRDLATPSPLPQCSPPQIPFLMPTGPSGWSLHRSTHSRIMVVQRMATELSTRVESAMAQLRMAKRPLDWSSWGWLPRSLALPEKPGRVFRPESPWEAFGEAQEAGALPKTSHFQSPSAGAPPSQEGVAIVQATTEGGLCSFSAAPVSAASPEQPEEKLSTVHMKDPKGNQEGDASVSGFPVEGFLTPEKPRASVSRPAPLFFSERMVADSSIADSPLVLRQTCGMENCSEKQPEKLDLEKMQEAGFQLGRCLNPSQQQQASEPPLPSANVTHSKASLTEESGDRSEATSQWSEVGQFYGSSSTFCRFGLRMVKQSLQEEELRARHQSALLRLREQALQEQVRAELAWLEHQKCLQGAEGASVTVKARILTRLKQEQAEILHLQNVCRAAHQRRKLLLRQHKELLLVQQSTEQLWRQMHLLAGTPHHQVDAGTPTNFEGAVVPEKDKSTQASSPALDITSSEDSFGLLQGRNYDSLHTERGEILSPRTKTAEGYPEQKFRPEAPCAELLDMAVEDLPSWREQVTRPPEWAGSMTADREHKAHPDLMTHPKEDHCHGSFNKETATMSLENLASEASFATLRHSSPEKGSLQFDSEFHKARAVLINISGSSPSASDLEAEASQTTDVSLPEEFIFQDPLHKSCGADVPDNPAVPQVASEESTWPLDPQYSLEVSCDGSQAVSAVLHGQEKPLNNAGTYQSDAAVLSHSEMPRSNSPWAGGSSLQADVSPDRQNTGFLSASALLPGVENNSVNKMVFQGRPQSAAATSLGSAAVRCPENWRKQSPTSPVGIAERDANNEQHSSERTTDVEPTECAHEALKNRESISDPVQDIVLLPSDQIQPFSSTPSWFSKDVYIPESKRSPMEHSVTKERVPEMEDDIQSPVDEVLTYGSADLPSPDTSFPHEDLPAPPEDLSENSDDSSHSTLKDFPSPPEQLFFPETGELEYCMEEDASVQTSNVPSLLENPVQETLECPPLTETGMASAQLPSGFSSSKTS